MNFLGLGYTWLGLGYLVALKIGFTSIQIFGYPSAVVSVLNLHNQKLHLDKSITGILEPVSKLYN